MTPKHVRVNFVVEGVTEETFVRRILAPAFAPDGLYLYARSVETGSHRGRIARGGMTTYAKARRDIQNWLAEDRTAYLTTMFDLYRLPGDFPGLPQAKSQTDAYMKVEEIEKALTADMGDPRFVAHVQLHEFEGLLFSEVSQIDAVLCEYAAASRLADLEKIRAAFVSPEKINDGPTTAPSKRLMALYPGYDKPAFGPLIANRIGLAKIRAECSHFDAWLARLERLPSLE